jgi:O-antigen/teichoic acid export membrane protein
VPGLQPPHPPAGPPDGDADLRLMARGGGLNLIGAVCSQGSLLAITILLAVGLGARSVGRYAECYAVLSLLGLLSLCGFRAALTRFVAMHLADRDLERLRGTVRLGMTLSIASSSALGLALVVAAEPIAGVFHDRGLVLGLRLVGLTLPAATFTDAALAATQGWRTQRPFTFIGRIYEPVARLVLTATALLLGAGLKGAFWALAVGAWSTSLFAARALYVKMKVARPATPRYDLGAIFSFSMISWVSTLASTGLIWADTLLLGVLTNAKDVGVYNVSTRIVTLAVFVMAPINAAFAPHIAHLHHTGQREQLGRTYAAATGWIVRLSLPAFVVLVVFPRDLLRLFGHNFGTGATVAAVLAVGQLVNAATGPCGTLLNMSGRVRVNMVDSICVLALNVALNLVLIPRLGVLGAAIAWSVSLALVNLTRLLQVRLLMGVTPFGPGLFRGLAAGVPTLVAAVVVRAVLDGWRATTVVGITVVVVVYVGSVLLLRLTDDDRLVLGLLSRSTPGGHQLAAN